MAARCGDIHVCDCLMLCLVGSILQCNQLVGEARAVFFSLLFFFFFFFFFLFLLSVCDPTYLCRPLCAFGRMFCDCGTSWTPVLFR